MKDLYLDPNFTVEGDGFVFEAHDDNNIDHIVKVTFDDVAAWLELPPVIGSIWQDNKDQMHESCQQIVDRYQTGTTSYDVEIKRKKVKCYEFTKNVRKTQVTTIMPVSNFENSAIPLPVWMAQNKYKSYKEVLC